MLSLHLDFFLHKTLLLKYIRKQNVEKYFVSNNKRRITGKEISTTKFYKKELRLGLYPDATNNTQEIKRIKFLVL